METIHKNKQVLILAAVAAAGAGVAAIATQANSFIERGLSDSQKIRVAEANNCLASGTEEARFVGCNSIL